MALGKRCCLLEVEIGIDSASIRQLTDPPRSLDPSTPYPLVFSEASELFNPSGPVVCMCSQGYFQSHHGWLCGLRQATLLLWGPVVSYTLISVIFPQLG